MPTYAYRCKSCSFEFEEVQKFSDESLVQCPSCKKDTLVRIIGGAGLVFKGSGFYLTDYKNKPAKETKTSTPAKPETKSEPSAPAKPAESSPSKSSDDSSPKS